MPESRSVFALRLAVAALLAGGLGMAIPAGSAPAAKAAAPRDDAFYESVDVSVVNLDVFVTDARGEPVSGLQQKDFEVLEDGRPVAITNFFSQREPDSAAAPAAEAAAPAGSAPGTAVPPAAEPERIVAVFVDNRNLEPSGRARVFAKLDSFLQGLAPTDRVILIAADRTFKTWALRAADKTALTVALGQIRAMAPGGIEQRSERDNLIREIELGSSARGALAMSPESGVRLFAEKRLREVRATLATLERTVGMLAGLPGHKALLYVSSGLPMRPAESLFKLLEAQGKANLLDSFHFDATPELHQVVARANASRVTFYTLGVTTGDGAVALRSHLMGPEELAEQEFGELGSLVDLAGSTGGLAALDPNDPGILLGKIDRDLATFYSLGYAPPPQKPGATRHVKVRVKRPGLTVRYRETYQAKSGAEATLDRTTTALMLGEAHNPLGIAVDLGAAKPARKGNLTVEVTVKFPLERLAILPTDGVHKGLVRLFIASRDARGNTSEITQIAIPIRIPQDQLAAALKQHAGYRTNLLLRPEPSQVVVGLRDELGNGDSTLIVPWQPPAGKGKT